MIQSRCRVSLESGSECNIGHILTGLVVRTMLAVVSRKHAHKSSPSERALQTHIQLTCNFSHNTFTQFIQKSYLEHRVLSCDHASYEEQLILQQEKVQLNKASIPSTIQQNVM